jgi:EAL and modified HD-GYP domain-containing signal transduction protein
VKIDLLLTPHESLAPLTSRLRARGLCVLAEKVETAEAFEAARTAGCSLFQGYFFCRPTTHATGALAPHRVAYLRLLAALNQPTLTLAKLEAIIKQDASFSYRVLRLANSAASSRQQPVHSIRDALLLIGQDRVRKWASIWAMAGVGEHATKELLNLTILRARWCELLGEAPSYRGHGSDHFLLGLCSLLDVILAKPMEIALHDLPLSTDTRAALLGVENAERHMLDAVVAYERGAWETAQQTAARGGIAEGSLPNAYIGALKWTWALAQNGGS